ncbi:MAG: phosphopentomutase [Lachnospiraceae bacterium]|nr:phosphopentomutase [Lachnospiraceae bacterium]
MGRRVIWIVLDSVGIGMLPDADKYDDVGADTLGHIIEKYPNINIPNMRYLGLDNISSISFQRPREEKLGCFGKAMEMSCGKDTTTGHYEMIGIHTRIPFPTFKDGFPKEIINEFLAKTGCKGVLGNKVASGIPIIYEYGDEHMKTGYPIVYTSADSVFQIAASEETFGLDRLYEVCQIARDMLKGEWGVGRVIARPFIKKGDEFERTSNRRDYALSPDEDNVLVHLRKNNITVAGVGKISDIFNGVGVEKSVHTTSNADGMQKTIDYMDTVSEGLIFTNLVDFDMKYGHRRDVEKYMFGLEEFDKWLGNLIPMLKDDDLLIINADHGCDPTYKGSDHTREYIPILIYGNNIKRNVDLGILDTFADIGKTVEEYLLGKELKNSKSIGNSFLNKLKTSVQ